MWRVRGYVKVYYICLGLRAVYTHTLFSFQPLSPVPAAVEHSGWWSLWYHEGTPARSLVRQVLSRGPVCSDLLRRLHHKTVGSSRLLLC